MNEAALCSSNGNLQRSLLLSCLQLILQVAETSKAQPGRLPNVRPCPRSHRTGLKLNEAGQWHYFQHKLRGVCCP